MVRAGMGIVLTDLRSRTHPHAIDRSHPEPVFMPIGEPTDPPPEAGVIGIFKGLDRAILINHADLIMGNDGPAIVGWGLARPGLRFAGRFEQWRRIVAGSERTSRRWSPWANGGDAGQ